MTQHPEPRMQKDSHRLLICGSEGGAIYLYSLPPPPGDGKRWDATFLHSYEIEAREDPWINAFAEDPSGNDILYATENHLLGRLVITESRGKFELTSKAEIKLPGRARDVVVHGNEIAVAVHAGGCSYNMMLRGECGAAILVDVSPELLPAAYCESQSAYRQDGSGALVLPTRTRFA